MKKLLFLALLFIPFLNSCKDKPKETTENKSEQTEAADSTEEDKENYEYNIK